MIPLRVENIQDSFIGPEAQPQRFRLVTDFIVIHHAGAFYPPGTAAKRIFDFHNRKWPEYGRIGYQIILEEQADGSIVLKIVNPLASVGAHIGGLNHRAVGLCAATSFSKERPTERWRNAIAFAVKYLKGFYPAAAVKGHKEIALAAFPTDCPGPFFSDWKPDILRRIEVMPTQVIGVRPSCTFNQFWGFLSSRAAPLVKVEAERAYNLAAWLDIDPCYVAAVWYAEQGSNLHALGATEVGKVSRNPFNIKAYGRFPSVTVKRVKWNSHESWQLGLFYGILHLKEFYGREKLLTVEDITPVFAPEGDGNAPTAYMRRVLDTMQIIKSLPA